MSDEILAILDAALDEAGLEAAELRQSFEAQGPPSEDDMREVARSGRLVDRFLADVDEALKQIFVAGLAYPDPELPDELAALTERAGRHGLPTAMAHLSRLTLLVEAVSEQRDLITRQQFAHKAWDETQRFLAWVRLFSTEHSHLYVQGRLAASSGSTEQRRVTYPARTMSVWPLGMELDDNGRAVIFARDLDSERVVLLRDHLAEFDPDRPLTSHAISRLFQDSIRLGDVLTSVIRLENHPVVTRSRALLFRPAFQAIPKLRPVADNFEPPNVPSMPLDLTTGAPAPVVSDGPAHLQLRIELAGRRLSITTLEGAEVPLSGPSPVLTFNLTKLLARESTRCLTLDALLLPRDDELLLLNLTTPLEGTVFPAYDPSLFRIADTVLARRAEATAQDLAESTCAGLWLCTSAYLLGAVDHESIGLLKRALAASTPRSLDDHYLLGLSHFLIGDKTPTKGLTTMVRTTLQLAVQTEESAIDLEGLALVLGFDEGEVSAADVKLVDGDAIYKALWLAMEAGIIDDLEGPIRQLMVTRYKGNLRSPTPGDVCARTLLLLLIDHYGGDTSGSGDSDALTFLSAFIEALAPSGKRKRSPMPELMEIYWYADTLALVTGSDRHGTPVSLIDIPRDRIAQSCADALFEWLASQRPSLEVATEAAAAMLMTAATGLRGLVLG